MAMTRSATNYGEPSKKEHRYPTRDSQSNRTVSANNATGSRPTIAAKRRRSARIRELHNSNIPSSDAEDEEEEQPLDAAAKRRVSRKLRREASNLEIDSDDESGLDYDPDSPASDTEGSQSEDASEVSLHIDKKELKDLLREGATGQEGATNSDGEQTPPASRRTATKKRPPRRANKGKAPVKAPKVPKVEVKQQITPADLRLKIRQQAAENETLRGGEE